MGAKLDALVGNLTQLAQGKDLEATRVGEQTAGPADELVQAAHAAYGLVAGTQVEVVSVAENNLRVERFENILRNGLDGACCTDGHEYGRLNCLMGQVEGRAASAGGACVEQVEVEAHLSILSGCGDHFALSLIHIFGVTMMTLMPALAISGRFADARGSIAVVCALLGMANGASGILLKWRLQQACAVTWWGASMTVCFGSEKQALVVFMVGIFLCQIVFGIACMMAEARAKKDGAHA